MQLWCVGCAALLRVGHGDRRESGGIVWKKADVVLVEEKLVNLPQDVVEGVCGCVCVLLRRIGRRRRATAPRAAPGTLLCMDLFTPHSGCL